MFRKVQNSWLSLQAWGITSAVTICSWMFFDPCERFVLGVQQLQDVEIVHVQLKDEKR